MVDFSKSYGYRTGAYAAFPLCRAHNTSFNYQCSIHYNGDFYINGTELTFTDEFIQNNLVDGKKIWKYAWFHHQETNIYGNIVYFFALLD